MSEYRVIMLGIGMVARPCFNFLHQNGIFVTFVDFNEERIDNFVQPPNCASLSLDCSDPDALAPIIEKHDLAICLLPDFLQHVVAKVCIEKKTHFLNTIPVLAPMIELHQKALDANVVLMHDCGLDPGIDHMLAMKMIDEIKNNGGRVTSFVSWCGGLPSPEFSNGPLAYKISWTPRGLINACNSSGVFRHDGMRIEQSVNEIHKRYETLDLYSALKLEGIPNRDSTPYLTMYGIESAETCLRGTLRYPGFFQGMQRLKDLGLTNPNKSSLPRNATTWPELLRSMLSNESMKESEVNGLIDFIHQKHPKLATILANIISQ